MERKLRPGEYVITRGADTVAERADCKRVLRDNGCRSVRFETIVTYLPDPDGTMQPSSIKLQAHGYLASLEGTPGVEPT